MTPAQYRAAIAKLGLSQERAGVWLGIAPRTSQGYALGEYPVPEPTAKFLRLVIYLKRPSRRRKPLTLDEIDSITADRKREPVALEEVQ